MTLKLPGDADIKINGETYRLRLTLGALAEIEDAFGGDFETFRQRLARPRVSDLLLVLHALVRASGAPITLELLKSSDIDFADAARAIGDAFRTLGREAEALEQGAPEKPPAAKAVAAGANPSSAE